MLVFRITDDNIYKLTKVDKQMSLISNVNIVLTEQ